MAGDIPGDTEIGAASQRWRDESLVRGYHMDEGLGAGEAELVGLWDHSIVFGWHGRHEHGDDWLARRRERVSWSLLYCCDKMP